MEWDKLKTPLKSSAFRNGQTDEYREYLNYKSKNTLIDKLHKLSLYKMNKESHLEKMKRITWGSVILEDLYLKYLPYRSGLAMRYTKQKNLHHSQIYQNGKPISSLSFDNQKDTTLLFDIQTDYFLSSMKDETKSYQLKIKARQIENFKIEEVKR